MGTSYELRIRSFDNANNASAMIPGWLNIEATIVDFEVAATAQSQPPESFSGVPEAVVVLDPQGTMVPAFYAHIVFND